MIFPTASGRQAVRPPLLDQATDALDMAERHLRNTEYFEAFELLGHRLSALYDRACAEGALAELRQTVRAHATFGLCQQDPYTDRAYRKPRGYAGDAVMLDYVYSGMPPAHTPALGKGIFQCTTRGPMGLSVLYRRSLLSAYINDTICRNPSARILSVASGHCRELDGTLATSDLYRGEIVAFDQDRESCGEVRRHFPNRVRSIEGSVKDLVGGKIQLGQFDLIYCAGLYDYLLDPFARCLTANLKDLLRPGARLVIGNFAAGSYGRGYLDLMMDWRLIYRNTADLIRITGDTAKLRSRSFPDPHDNVAYLELTVQ